MKCEVCVCVFSVEDCVNSTHPPFDLSYVYLSSSTLYDFVVLSRVAKNCDSHYVNNSYLLCMVITNNSFRISLHVTIISLHLTYLSLVVRLLI